MAETNVNREHKDRLFTKLFGQAENRKWTLELYNAVNGSNYDNPDDIEIITLEDSLYMGMKNDVSFILNEYVNIYEQQSTFNPNMPLRQFMYSGRLYDKYVHQHDLNFYGSSIVEIPIPKLVVFYNGTDKDAEDECFLHLSDAFANKEASKEADITVRVRMININHGHNKKLLEACKPLAEYSWFINEIRYNQKELKLEIAEAVDKAIDVMPQDYVIRPYLVGHRAEVRMSCLTEYDEAKVHGWFKEEGRKEGLEVGLKEGLKEGVANAYRMQISKKISKGKSLETIADEMEVTPDEIRDLYEEICKESIV